MPGPALIDYLGLIMTPTATPAIGDIVIRGGSGGWSTLPVGLPNQVLTMDNVTGYPTWKNAASGGFANPMTTTQDLIVGGAAGAAGRLPVGSNGQVLTVTGGLVGWAAGGLANPMTTAQDIIVGGAAGAPGRIAVGSNGQVLTVTAGVVGWANASSGFANPMTTSQDLIVGGAAGAAGRLAVGANGQVLGVTAGSVGWVTPAGGSASPALVPTAVKTGAYTAAVSDLVPCDISGGSFTVTLPTAPADGVNIAVKIIAVAAAAINTLTITRGGTDVFNVAGGSTSIVLRGKFQTVTLQYKASTGIWYVRSSDSGLMSPWVAVGAITSTTQTTTISYNIDDNGIVRFVGNCVASAGIAANVTLFTMPAGFRPTQDILWDMVNSAVGHYSIHLVAATGAMTTNGAVSAGGLGSFDGKFYPTT